MLSLSLDALPPKTLAAGLWLLGCGTMGGALLGRWLAAGLDGSRVSVIDPSPAGLPAGFAGRVFPTLEEAVAEQGRGPSLLVLGVKPQTLATLAPALEALPREGMLLFSMLAGVRTTTLAELLPETPMVRIMPNTPARIGKGITAAFAVELSETQQAFVEALLKVAGSVVWLEDEGKFDAVTAVSGCGPAFLYRFIEAFSGAGEAVGLEPEIAARLALETVVGAAALAAQSGKAPATLRRQVTSKGGVTEAGLDVLDGKGELSHLMRTTLRAAAERSRNLALAADSALDREA